MVSGTGKHTPQQGSVTLDHGSPTQSLPLKIDRQVTRQAAGAGAVELRDGQTRYLFTQLWQLFCTAAIYDFFYTKIKKALVEYRNNSITWHGNWLRYRNGYGHRKRLRYRDGRRNWNGYGSWQRQWDWYRHGLRHRSRYHNWTVLRKNIERNGISGIIRAVGVNAKGQRGRASVSRIKSLRAKRAQFPHPVRPKWGANIAARRCVRYQYSAAGAAVKTCTIPCTYRSRGRNRHWNWHR